MISAKESEERERDILQFLFICLFMILGPLVYPGGFVWLYSWLWYVTNEGKDILTAQYIFAIIYLLFIAAVFYVYYNTKAVSLCLSLTPIIPKNFAHSTHIYSTRSHR